MTPEEDIRDASIVRDIQEILCTLSDREAGVIRMRYGLDDGKEKTLEDVGAFYNVSGLVQHCLLCMLFSSGVSGSKVSHCRRCLYWGLQPFMDIQHYGYTTSASGQIPPRGKCSLTTVLEAAVQHRRFR